MAPETFKFQRGPICLTDNEAQPDLVDTNTKLSKFDIFTTVLHFLTVYISTAGIGSLVWTYIVLQGYEEIIYRPPLREEFVENFVAVIVLLSLSVAWSIFNLYLLRSHRLVPPHIFTLGYNMLMTFCLIYFPTVCCCRLYDRWSWFACAYLSDKQDKDCLPIYSKILEPEVVGLACGFVVALFHLLHIIAQVINFIIRMSTDGRYTRVGEWLYERGYSSRIAIYGVSWSLALIGWCMMLWSYDFLQTFGYREGGYHRFWSAHFLAGFDILTLLLVAVQLWFLENVVSMCLRKKPISDIKARFYDFGIAIALMCISIRCATQLNHLEESCQWPSQCKWIWKTIRPRQLAAIILALIVSLIHLSLCLNRLRSSLQWAKDKNRINVLLKSLTYNEDFGGMGKVYAHTWTDGQISSIFRIKTSGDGVREYVARVLHQIHDEEVAAFNSKLSKRQITLNNLKALIRQTLDGITWDDEHLTLLHNALYGVVDERPSKTSLIPKRYRHRIKNQEREAEVGDIDKL